MRKFLCRKITASFKMNLKADGPDCKMVFKFGSRVERLHSARKQGRRIYNTLLLQAMALYIHGPLRCKNLLGRIPNPHIRPALAAPQPTHPAGGDHAQVSSTGNRTPSTTRTPTIRPPGGIPDTRSTQPHGSDQTHSRPRWKLCNTRSLTRSVPRQHESPPDYQAGQAFSFA